MPAEQIPGDDLSDMAGVCSMDAYGQSDFDTADVRLALCLSVPPRQKACDHGPGIRRLCSRLTAA